MMLGCQAEVAANGQEAVEAVARTGYDLVLMDCQMPVLDGFAATAAIRRWEQAQSRPRLPIIALTANIVKGFREQCLAVGMDDYLSKPFEQEQLAALLEHWLPAAPAAMPVQPPVLGAAASNNVARPAGNFAPSTACRRPLRHAGRARPGANPRLAAARPARACWARSSACIWTSSAGLLQQVAGGGRRGDSEALRQAAHSLQVGQRQPGRDAVGGRVQGVGAAGAGAVPGRCAHLAAGGGPPLGAGAGSAGRGDGKEERRATLAAAGP
ncbi:MAG: response regulator [Chromatiales bacterium]|nr:response regulator [Chromatiales bacterium]